MSDEVEEGTAKKTVLIRIVEWSAFIPQSRDPNSQLFLSEGVTGFEAFENEKLLEVGVSSAGNQRHFPVTDMADGEVKNIPHGLYAFQAVLASNFDGPVPEGPKKD